VIRLAKTAEPQVLVLNKGMWTAEYREGADRRRYAHPDIREALRSETAQKCAYCESWMEHVSPANVEHIAPKSRFRELVVEWTNLTLACSNCNTSKGTYWEDACRLLNPYEDEPSEHLRWAGPMLFHITADRGRVTIRRLNLNRAELMHQRGEALDRVRWILDLMESNPEPVRLALSEDLRALGEVDAEYSAAGRAFLAQEALGD
jgi:uncharacterized protein (TIGR02646 family)